MKTEKLILAAVILGTIGLQPFVCYGDGDPDNDFEARNLDINGNTLLFGSLTGTLPTPFGLQMLYVDSTTTGLASQLIWEMNREESEWIWGRANGSGTAQAMVLDAGNALSLYSTADPETPVIVLDPTTSRIMINGFDIIKMGGMTSASTMAFGDSAADGAHAVTFGMSSATGDLAVAMGASQVEGANSFAMGESFAYSFGATAFGKSTADGTYATAMGASTATSYATALGNSSATGMSSVALGQSMAYGSGSVALGRFNVAIGNNSVAMGWFTTAPSLSQVVVGQHNSPLGTGDPENWVETDELFTVGNGVDAEHPSNALVILKNGDATFTGVVKVKRGGDIPMFVP